MKKNIFGQTILIKRFIIGIVGLITHKTFKSKRFSIIGSKFLNNIPHENVLFVSNHQTYFYDVIAMLHVFNSSAKGRVDTVKKPRYLLNPKTNLYYIASFETMKKSLITKLLIYAGAVLVKRSWRESGRDKNRDIRTEDPNNIKLALKDGWVITFPQGTTTPFKPIRKGTAHLIKQYKPIVIPIVIDGFRRSFDKKGIRVKKKNVLMSMTIKKPLKIDYLKDSTEEIIKKIEFSPFFKFLIVFYII